MNMIEQIASALEEYLLKRGEDWDFYCYADGDGIVKIDGAVDLKILAEVALKAMCISAEVTAR